MKIFVLANTRIPTEKAHGWQIMKQCESLSVGGAEVTLLVPYRKNIFFKGMDPFEYYDVKRVFKIEYVKIFDGLSYAKNYYLQIFLGFLATLSFIKAAMEFLLPYKMQKDTIVLTRDQRVLYFLMKKISNNFKFFYEMHDFPESAIKMKLYRNFIKKVDGIIVTNKWKEEQLINQFHVEPSRILVARHAISDDFIQKNDKESKISARESLGLPQDGPIALYSGSLFDWKGVPTLIKAAQLIPEVNVLVLGGNRKDFEKLLVKIGAINSNNVLYIESVPHHKVPEYLAAADLFLIPNSGKTIQSRFATAPLKLVEYAAMKRPMIISDLPSMRDAISENAVYFCEPDNPEELGRMIKAVVQKIISCDTEITKKVEAAFSEMSGETWESRARKMLHFFALNLKPGPNT